VGDVMSDELIEHFVSIGVEVCNTDGTYKTFGEILNEISKRWRDLTDEKISTEITEAK
jgi:hypothetical protein